MFITLAYFNRVQSSHYCTEQPSLSQWKEFIWRSCFLIDE